MPVVTDYTAIWTPSSWNGSGVTSQPIILTYSFNTTAPAYVAAYYGADFANSLTPFSAEEQALTRAALQAWADASGITFIEAPSGQGDLQFGKYDFHFSPVFAGGFAHFPGTSLGPQSFFTDQELAGDVFINQFDGVQFHEIIHEIGHAIGFKHPFEGDITIDPSMNNTDFTVLSYSDNGTVVDGLGTLDVEAAQVKYGLPSEDRDYVWDPDTLTLTQTGGAAADWIRGVFTSDIISGLEGDDVLAGAFGDDIVDGGPGNDSVYGGSGNDRVIGGGGDDYLRGDGGDDIVIGGDGVDSVDGGEGSDVASYEDAITGVNASLVAPHTNTGFAAGDSYYSIDGLRGSSFDDQLTGDHLSNSLNGGLGVDTISGGAGNDTILYAIGDGNGSMNGGADADTLNLSDGAAGAILNTSYDGAALTALSGNALTSIETITANLGDGVDWLVYAAGSAAVTVNLATGAASGFTSISSIERVVGGNGNDALTGNGVDNRLDGGAGNDTLAGGGGVDTLTGDALDNRLDGQGGNDTLNGGAGSDTVLGGDGDDVIYASAGNDSLQGLAGNDTFHWTSTDGRDTFSGGVGTDAVNLTGSAVADVADANWNGSVITGLLNNALIDIETINLDLGAGGTGGDWLRYNTTFGISVDLGAGTATGFASITGVENLIGGTGGDALIGDGGNNKINGNAGDDFITGGGGADNLIGGAGADTFVYAAGCGNDTIVDFDAWDVGGQDFLDVSAFGIDAGNFAARVAIIDTGADTVIRIDDTYFITLKNVSGDGDNSITSADFILA